MIFNSFLNPMAIQDTPRLFTALAEWLSVFILFFIYRRKIEGLKFVITCILSLVIQVFFQFIAGLLPLIFWIPCMIIAVLLMYFFIWYVLDMTPIDCGILTLQAFLLAEFAASMERQIYIWYVSITDNPSLVVAFICMIIIYILTYSVFYRVELGNIPNEYVVSSTKKEFCSALFTGIGAFALSNLSFVLPNTPLSQGVSSFALLYIRTLVDFGGLLMLMSERLRINELHMKHENDAINQLFHKQYEQYKLAVDNSELLRKEMHDFKHYIIALRNESNPEKREEFLSEMEQEIAIQESFLNTGNQVLDVIFTTKNLECQKKGITLNAMIDGDAIKFMHVKDLCAVFGNLLDNATEAAQQVSDMDKRLITLSVRQKNQFVIVECENFSEKRIQFDEKTRLIQTTKQDASMHGYGLKSIRQVAEKYDGSLTISQSEAGWVTTKVLMSIR